MRKSTWHIEGALRRGRLKIVMMGLFACACAGAMENTSMALPKDMSDKELVDTLSSGDARQRAEACERLGDSKSSLAVAQIGQVAQNDSSLKVREECIEALSKIGGPESANVLRKIAASDPNEAMRLDALDALDEVDTEELAIPVVIQILKSDNSIRVRKEAAELIGDQKWKSGIPALAEVAQSNAPLELRRDCLEQLFKMGDPAGYAVVYDIMLQSDSVEMRRKAADLIKENPQASAFRPLCQALNDQDDKVAEDAVDGLVKLGDKSAAPVLREAAKQRSGKLAKQMNEAADKLSK